jgi:hypothetical protein
MVPNALETTITQKITVIHYGVPNLFHKIITPLLDLRNILYFGDNDICFHVLD